MTAAFDHADIGAINTHPFGYRFLAQASGDAIEAHIGTEEFADVHPQLRNRSRILVLRIIIRGAVGCSG